jgi:hypothetical protein
MLRTYWIYALISITAASVMMAICTALGRLQPMHPALGAFHPCEDTLCWNDITVHDTSSAVYRVLSEQGYLLIDTYTFTPDVVAKSPLPHACTFRAHLTRQEEVNLLNLNACPDLRLGDVMAVFGTPNGLSLCQSRLTLYYHPDHTVLLHIDDVGAFTLYSPVTEITFYGIAPRDDWHGFALLWRYRLLNGQCR